MIEVSKNLVEDLKFYLIFFVSVLELLISLIL